MKNKEQILLETHGDKNLNIDGVKKAMGLYAEQSIIDERSAIYNIIYDLVPTGEISAWDCIKTFQLILSEIEDRGIPVTKVD